MTGIKANNRVRARITRVCGILKGKKSMVQELLLQRAEDKKKEDKRYKAKKGNGKVR